METSHAPVAGGHAPSKTVRAGLFLLVLAALATVPIVATDFQLFRCTNVVILALALVGVNLLVGYNGQVSLGHGAFYAIGAYATALMVLHAGAPHWLAVPLAGAVCLVVGALSGLPLLKLAPVHVMMATFAMGAVVPTLGKWKGVERWTGGAQGLGIDEPEVPFGLPLSFDQWIYLFTLGLTALCYLLMVNLMSGRVGRAVIAIRDHPIAAESLGIHAVAYKTAVFGLSAMLVGMAGGLSALSIKYVAPGLFHPFLSLGLLIGIAVGGLGSLTGALYGAVVLQAILLVAGASASALRSPYPALIYGVVLIVFLGVLPEGIAGLVGRTSGWLRRRLGRRWADRERAGGA